MGLGFKNLNLGFSSWGSGSGWLGLGVTVVLKGSRAVEKILETTSHLMASGQTEKKTEHERETTIED